MDTTPNPEPVTCMIRVKGHLGNRWEPWFDDMTITLDHSGDTILTGQVIDQSALHGLLRKIRDLGLPLVSVTCDEAGLDDDTSISTPRRSAATGGKDPFL